MSDTQKSPMNDEWKFEDLKRISEQVNSGLSHISKWFSFQFKRNWLVILLLAIVLFGWQAYRVKTYQPFFTSQASFIYQDLHKKTYGEMTDQLNRMIGTQAYKPLAKALNITESQASQMISVEALNMYGSKLSEDITTEKSPFYIRVNTLDKKAFDSLAQKICDYFNRNPYYAATVKRKQIRLAEEIDQLKHELLLLDSIKYQYIRSNGAIRSSATLHSEAFNPVLLFDKSIDISRSITEKKADLNDVQSVELLNDFSVSEHPVSIDKKAILVKSALIFITATFAILCLSSIFKKK